MNYDLSEDKRNKDISVSSMVSVVIPVFQVETWLRTCLDSVIKQTYDDLEILLIDDGSTDSCSAICDEYTETDSRIRVVHQENGGLGHARNVGIDLAHGKYIIFLDSDDYWQPETVEQLCLIAERDQTQVIAFAADTRFDEIEPFRCIDYCHTVQNGKVNT